MKKSDQDIPEWRATILLILFLMAPLAAFSQQTFEEYQSQQQQAFTQFIEDDSTAFAQYKADVEKKWQEFLDSSREQWVSYSEGKETKRVVNFEEGYVEIETLVEATEPEPLKKAQEQIVEQVQEIIQEEDGAGAKVLDGQLATADGNVVTDENAENFAEGVSVETKIEEQSQVGTDKIERLVVKVRIPMVPDHLMKRAEQYLVDVKRLCIENELDVAMVMALVQTESFFNPMAKSQAPAYGLMQLVPTSGGREANRFVFSKDESPSPHYLYNPRNNIQLGTGYLKKMRTAEFSNVTNSQNALYCIICAYNTGPGNVAKAITGKRNLGPAIDIINTMTPDELYAKLVRDLPYAETRDYIQRVVDRAPNYVAWR